MRRQPPVTEPLALSSALPLLLLGLALAGWDAVPAAADESAWNMVFDVTEINVVNVEVVVTDSKGRFVPGLTRDDFELMEDGEPVEISNFYAMENGAAVSIAGDEPAATEAAAAAVTGTVEPMAAAPTARPIHLVIYVDTANITKANRDTVLNRLREFLLESWREGMRVMLVSNDGPSVGSAVIRQGFTSVPQDLFVALEDLSKAALSGPRLDQDHRTLMRDVASIKSNTSRSRSTDDEEALSYEEDVHAEAQHIMQRVAIYSQQALVEVRRTLGTLSRFVDTMAGMPGRKSILFVSDGLDITPGADLLESLRSYFSTASRGSRGLGPSPSETLDSDRLNATRDVQELVDRANAHRVTLNVLDAAPSTLAVGVGADRDRGSGTTTGTWSESGSSFVQRNRVESLMAMAVETGGQAGVGLSAVARTIDGVLTDFDNHYSLGYVADRREGERRSRTIKVAVKGRRDVEVRHRSSIRDKTMAERAAERAQAALLVDDFSGSDLGDNPLDVALARRESELQEDGNFVVPVLVTIPLGKLVLVPGEEVHQARLTMFVAVRDEKGRTSEVNQHLCPIRIPNAEVLTALGQRATCGIRLLMRSGPQRVAVSVLDATAAVHSTVRLDLDVGSAASAVSEQAALH